MTKLCTPTIKVVLTREVDGNLQGARSWTMRVHEIDADKFEDALAYFCDSALKATPIPPADLRVIDSKKT